MTTEVFRVVLDTNVVFEGLTRRTGACGLIIDAWFNNHIQVCLSSSLSLEYQDVLSRRFSEEKWHQARIALNTLFQQVSYTPIYYTWRPTSPDPGDDLVIDCAMNANALLVTSNIKDFRKAQSELGLAVMTPLEFVIKLGS
jgi:putative PIN family toxin of toxin-antitoxin system